MCHEGCAECKGPGNNNCVKCNEDAEYYELEEAEARESDTKSCIYLCLSPTKSLYLSDNMCKACDINCLICHGASNKECSKCKPPIYLGNGQECLHPHCTNYPNTIPINNLCERCNYKCQSCLNTPDYCLLCANPYLLNSETHDCGIQCPRNYYPNHIIHTCQCNIYTIYIYSLSKLL